MSKKISFPFLMLMVALFLTSCEEADFTIKSDISDEGLVTLFITNQIQRIYDTITVKEEPVLTLALPDGPTILKISADRMMQYVYAEPGKSVTLVKNAEENDIRIISETQAEQDAIAEMDMLMNKAMNGNDAIFNIGKLDAASFIQKVEEKYIPVENFIAELQSKGINKDLIKWLDYRIEAGKAMDLVNYPQYHKYLTKNEAELSENYYNFVEKFDFSDASLYYFDDVKSAGEAIIGYEFNFEEMESIAAYYAAIYNAIPNYTQDPDLKEMFEYKVLDNKINYAGGVEGMQKEIESFIATAQTPHRIENIKALAKKWEPLQKGLPAPDFSAYTRDGEEVKLSDFKGKNVYIDVWATWCGPCIAEIPSLKAMEEKYHDENIEFVSVSIDRLNDRGKWMKFIEEKELGGTQIMAQNDWRSEITQFYNISGIPRFLLIDEEGKIVTADAPRPSNAKQLEGMFAELLK